jgi:hypothetical protein
MKLITCILLLFFVGNLSAQRTFDLKTTPVEGQTYLKITNGKFIFWIEQEDFCDIFSEKDLGEIKTLVESITDIVSIEYLTTEISKITQETEDLDRELRYLIYGDEVLIERVIDGLFLSEFTSLTENSHRKLVDNQGELIVKDWIQVFHFTGTPTF